MLFLRTRTCCFADVDDALDVGEVEPGDMFIGLLRRDDSHQALRGAARVQHAHAALADLNEHTAAIQNYKHCMRAQRQYKNCMRARQHYKNCMRT